MAYLLELKPFKKNVTQDKLMALCLITANDCLFSTSTDTR